MRTRPFLDGSEASRKFSAVRTERDDDRPLRLALSEIERHERDAKACTDPAEAKRLQCEAEALRCAIAEVKS